MARAQQPLRERFVSRPEHQWRIDHVGVYYERKRLKSKYRGVRWVQHRDKHGEWEEGRWQVMVWFQGADHYGGVFREENELVAALAYDDLAIKLRGEQARLNFPRDEVINEKED